MTTFPCIYFRGFDARRPSGTEPARFAYVWTFSRRKEISRGTSCRTRRLTTLTGFGSLRSLRAFVTATAVVAFVLAASTAHAQTNPKHFFWPQGSSNAPTPNSLANDLLYHGGNAGSGAIGVETPPAAYVVFWGPEWANGFTITDVNGVQYSSQQLQSYVTSFLTNVGGTSWLATTSEYCKNVPAGTTECSTVGNATYVTNPRKQLKGVWTDTTAVPANIVTTGLAQNLADDPIADEAMRASAHFNYDPQATYIILTPPDSSATGAGSVYCGYHTQSTSVNGIGNPYRLQYAFIPYLDAGTGCGMNSVNLTSDSFGHGVFDGYSIVIGHEYAEAITDPDNFSSVQDGWNDSSTQEIGDKCAWLQLKNIGMYQKTSFAVQPLWSNRAFDGGGQGCVQKEPTSPHAMPPVGVTPPAIAVGGVPGVAAGQPMPVNMAYFGGQVQPNPKLYLVLWGWGVPGAFNHTSAINPPNDPDGAGSLMQHFMAAIGGTSWQGVTTQYYQSNLDGTYSRVGNSPKEFSGVWADNSNPIHDNLQPLELAQEAARAVQYFGISSNALPNTQIVVATPQMFNESGFNQGNYCAWHDYTTPVAYPGVTTGISFTNMPYVLNAGGGCGQDFVNPAPTGDLDGVTIVLGHEIAETLTDPGAEEQAGQVQYGAWFDYQSYEIGDKCAWVGDGLAVAGSPYNMTGNDGRTYAVQALWSNQSLSGVGYCSQGN